VVTSFELQLHPVGPLLHSGLVVYPGSQARDVLRALRDFNEASPDELTVWALLRKAPPLPFLPPEVHGTDVLILPLVYAGPPEEGARITLPLTKLGTPIASVLAPQPYDGFQRAFDPLLSGGARNYWKSSEFEELGDDLIDILVEAGRSIPVPECELLVPHLGGAMGRVPSDATAYVGRDTRYVVNVHGRWRSPSDDAKVRDWARGIFDRLAPFATGGGYVNFLTADEGERVASAYGANYERLREIKQRIDPRNLFRMNHNIPPEKTRARRASPPARAGAPK
jgi:FAD/FMN-containing dehydrogenase